LKISASSWIAAQSPAGVAEAALFKGLGRWDIEAVVGEVDEQHQMQAAGRNFVVGPRYSFHESLVGACSIWLLQRRMQAPCLLTAFKPSSSWPSQSRHQQDESVPWNSLKVCSKHLFKSFGMEMPSCAAKQPRFSECLQQRWQRLPKNRQLSGEARVYLALIAFQNTLMPYYRLRKPEGEYSAAAAAAAVRLSKDCLEQLAMTHGLWKRIRLLVFSQLWGKLQATSHQ